MFPAAILKTLINEFAVKYARPRLFGGLLLMSLLAGCGGSGSPVGGIDIPGTGANTGEGEYKEVVIYTEPGFNLGSAPAIVNGLGRATIKGRAANVPVFRKDGRTLCFLVNDSDQPILAGWIDKDRSELSTTSTAEVLTAYASGGAFLTDFDWKLLLEQARTLPEFQQLTAAITASLKADGGSLANPNESVRSAMETLIAKLGFKKTGASSSAKVLINPSEELGGICLNQPGINRVNFRNRLRRSAYAFIERDSYFGEDNLWHESPAKFAEMEIPSVAGLRNTIGTFTDIVTGKFAYAEVETAATKLEVVPGSKKTRYKVSIVGFGDTFGKLFTLPDYQQQKQKEVALKWFATDLLLPFLASVVIPGMGLDDSKMFHNDADALTDYLLFMTLTIPAISDNVAKGDAKAALWEAYNGLVSSTSFRTRTIEFLIGTLKRTAGAAAANEAFLMAKQVFNAVGVVDKILYGFDVVSIIFGGASANALNMGDQWIVDVTKPTLLIEAETNPIKPHENTKITVKVPEAANCDPPVNLAYHWKNTASAGSIADPQHSSDEFDSTSDFIQYFADKDTVGSDTITVDVYQVEQSTRELIGTTSITMDVNGTKVTIDPAKKNLKPAEKLTLTLKYEPEKPKNTQIVAVWTVIGKGGLLGPNGDQSQIEMTDSDTCLYTTKPDGRGVDRVEVDVFTIVDGQRKPFGKNNAILSVNPYTVIVEPGQSSIKQSETVQLRAKIDPAPPAGAELAYRWSCSGRVGYLLGGELESPNPFTTYRARSNVTGQDFVAVTVLQNDGGEWTQIGIDDGIVNVGSEEKAVTLTTICSQTDGAPDPVDQDPENAFVEARVEGKNGKRLANVPVTFRIIGGNGELIEPTSRLTDGSGVTHVNVRSGGPGYVEVAAEVPSKGLRDTALLLFGVTLKLSPDSIMAAADKDVHVGTATLTPFLPFDVKYEWNQRWSPTTIDGVKYDGLTISGVVPVKDTNRCKIHAGSNYHAKTAVGAYATVKYNHQDFLINGDKEIEYGVFDQSKGVAVEVETKRNEGPKTGSLPVVYTIDVYAFLNVDCPTRYARLFAYNPYLKEEKNYGCNSGKFSLGYARFTRSGEWPDKEATEYESKIRADYEPYILRAEPVYSGFESEHQAYDLPYLGTGNPTIPPAKKAE